MVYIDLFLISVPKKSLAEYKKQSAIFGKVALDHGALRYRELQLEDPKSPGAKNYTQILKPKKGEVIISAITDFKSRKHRDAVMKKVSKDPRLEELLEQEQVFDSRRMVYGGFGSLVDLE